MGYQVPCPTCGAYEWEGCAHWSGDPRYRLTRDPESSGSGSAS